MKAGEKVKRMQRLVRCEGVLRVQKVQIGVKAILN